MRIVFANATRSWGGVKTWTLETAAHLHARGHAVWLFGRPGPFVDKARAAGIDAQALSFGMDFSPWRILCFHRFFKRHNVDLVLGNIGKDMRTAGVAARLAGIPVVQRIGAQGDLADTAKIRFQFRLVRPHLLTNCEDIKRKLLEKLPFLEPEALTVILPGKPVRPEPPDAVVHPGGPRVLVTTNQLVEGKCMPDLLRALAGCRARGLAFELHVVGSGPEESPLKALAHELGLDGSVRWHGFSTNVAEHLACADIFCLSSRAEGVPQGLLEALAQGLAPVVRGVGGIPEAFPPGLDDLMPPYEEGHQALEASLATLLGADDERLISCKRTAWEHAAKTTNAAVQAEKLETWLASIAGSSIAGS